MSPPAPRGKLVIAINEAWNIANFRAGLIRALQADGWEVVAMAARDTHVPRVEALGCRFVEVPMAGGGMNPFAEWRLYRRFKAALAAERPDAFLGYTVKPNVWGSLAAQALGIPVINNIAGLGTAFIRRPGLALVVRRLYRWALRRSHCVLFQNEDDRQTFIAGGLVATGRTARVPGSGVDLDHFQMTPLPPSGPLELLFIGRLLRDKGVRELAEAARLLQAAQVPVRISLLGRLDESNRSAIDRAELDGWLADGRLRYLGSSDDVRPYIAAAHAVVLPSYREGVPRTLLEAAAMGRPLIATDVVGSRDAVDAGVNGLLARERDAADLAAQCRHLAEMDDAQRAAMGRASRAKVEREFGEQRVVAVYRKLLRGLGGAVPAGRHD